MAKLPFTKDFAFEIVEDYLLYTMDIIWCVTNYDHLKRTKELLLGHRDGSLLDSVFTYAETGIWNGSSPDEAFPIFLDLFEMQMPDYLGYGNHDRREELAPLIDMMTTRFYIDPFEGISLWGYDLEDFQTTDFYDPENEYLLISRKSLALLEGKTEETIRAAMYKDGDLRLKPVRRDLYSPVDIKRWQIATGSFQPSLYLREVELEPEFSLTSFDSLRGWLRSYGEEQQTGKTVKIHEVKRILPGSAQAGFEEFMNCSDEATSWFDLEAAEAMAECLQVSPRWLAENVFRLFDSHSRKQQIESLPSNESFKARLEKQKAGDIADEVPATHENIECLLDACQWLQLHPLQRKATAKISGYLSESGTTLLHEFNLRKQYVWVPKNDGEHLPLSKRFYPSSDVGVDGRYGRNSGIKKFDTLAYADLYRIQIESCGDLRMVLEQLK
ncbi:hypothetical protein NX722_21175 [Endozoicomonas gorgoniicola]|uniref:Uncharacterized protein n=1 Tax=Endozoicomonas gorgoniicola TaxID=1234144 RepID=A0ABT3N179_9GAMM|nr:hypothetical protein [Endozoicomonas gorgoniicola]MCW7555088.1 hypothetical protein [Endozoicomonas gorgoniicola]